MSSSNVFSRFLPSGGPTASIYHQINEQEQVAQSSHYDRGQVYQHDRDGYHDGDDDNDDDDVDERNLNEEYRDEDLEHLLNEAAASHITAESTRFAGAASQQRRRTPKIAQRPRWMKSSTREGGRAREEEDLEPGNLLLEDRDNMLGDGGMKHHEPAPDYDLPQPVPGSSTRKSRVQFDQEHAAPRPYTDQEMQAPPMPEAQYGYSPFADRREKAHYRWANVQNLDVFLKQAYNYYNGHGVWSILLENVLFLLTLGFVVTLTIFLGSCVNYHRIPSSSQLDEIIIDKCTQKMSPLTNLFIWMFSAYWIFKLVELPLSVPGLLRLHDFYLYLLDIEDSEMQTISWPQVVQRLKNLRESNPTTALNLDERHREWMGRQVGKPVKQRMDAHDIANRLMRKENYLIALYNKDILDFTLPIAGLRKRQLLSRSVEWSVYLCVVDFVFNEEGQVKQLFLKDTSRKDLIEALQRRFLLVGFMHIVAGPFTVVYFIIMFFLRNFSEFKSKPAEITSRSYSPLAEWKFREFNELPHLFRERMNLSYPFAKHYVDQFPKDKTIQLARFVAFVSGALAAVLAVVSLLDPNSFLEFEITPKRTVLFYIGVFGAIWTASRGMVPDDSFVFNPEEAMTNVIYHTHYEPDHWKGRLHAEDVRREFSELYQMKVATFFEEIFSIVAMPFIFWFSLPPCADKLIDFFREFTVHVDGLGYVCSFAVFDFKSGAGQENRTSTKDAAADKAKGGSEDARSEYYGTKHGKMRDSMMSFKQAYLDPQFAHLRPYAHRAFRTPPSFPGLGGSSHFRSASASREPHMTTRSPPGKMRASGVSPAPSLLLHERGGDHGQLSMRKSRVGASRYQTVAEETEEEGEVNAGPSASVMFEEEDDDPGRSGGGGRRRLRNEEGAVGGGHASGDRRDHDDGGEDDEDDNDDHGIGNDGVLGMLTKFTELGRQGPHI